MKKRKKMYVFARAMYDIITCEYNYCICVLHQMFFQKSGRTTTKQNPIRRYSCSHVIVQKITEKSSLQ